MAAWKLESVQEYDECAGEKNSDFRRTYFCGLLELRIDKYRKAINF